MPSIRSRLVLSSIGFALFASLPACSTTTPSRAWAYGSDGRLFCDARTEKHQHLTPETSAEREPFRTTVSYR